MASTKYTVRTATAVIAEGVSKKSAAVELAEANKGAELVEVVTSAGTVVHEVAAKRAINYGPRYTRQAKLPEGFEVPEGARAAYVRRNGVILHFADAPKGEQYRVADATTGKMLKGTYPTTRAAGARLNLGVGKGRVVVEQETVDA